MQRAKQAKKNIHNSMDDIRDHAAGMGGSVRDIGEAVKNVLIDKFSDMLRSAVSLGETSGRKVSESAEELREDLEERIQERPYRALMIAASIGLAVGLILRRR